jgi:two-component system response regulator AtoC
MDRLHRMAARVAASDCSVLITGETGVGKDVMARMVHRLSRRSEGPFLAINCAALTESLAESELFGFEKGTFTGAAQTKIGLIEATAGGTLFLDELGDMPLAIQAKLLRVVESREILRIGATRPRPVDVRLVSATNLRLEEEVAEKRFRQDLYFRLNVFTLEVPPLRERLEEIAPLARHFLDGSTATTGGLPPSLTPDALALLQGHSWPGNIRELRNVIERACVLCDGKTITVADLPIERLTPALVSSPSSSATGSPSPPASTSLVEIKQLERQAIVSALARCAGNQTRAARLLGMPRRTFCKRLKDYHVPRARD